MRVPLDAAAPERFFGVPAALRTASLVHGTGCAFCRHTGYRGRVGVFELVVVSDAMQDAIARGARKRSSENWQILARSIPLTHDAWGKVAAGLTTIDEVLRVVAA